MDMIRKLMPVEVKEVGDRTLEIAGSTEDVDRMGDIIKASGWKLGPFKKNPVFMWAHNYDDPPIGRANKVWVDKETKQLMFNVEFAGPDVYEFADTIYKLYKGGFLHATSVGFIPLNWEGKSEENPSPKWEGNIYTSQELLELSAVPVPANANALVSARDSGLITVKEFEAMTKEVVTKPEETEEYYRIPVKGEEGKHTDHRIRTIDIDKGKGIKALYCGECKVVITYLFDKEEWASMAECQGWVDEHSKAARAWLCAWPEDENQIMPYTQWQKEMEDYFGKPEETDELVAITREKLGEESVPRPKEASQAEIIDEMDYLKALVAQYGLKEEHQEGAMKLAATIIQRYQGSDIPFEIQSKVGAVLNQKNMDRLTRIQQLAQEVLDSAAKAEEGEKQVEPKLEINPVAEARQRVIEVAEVASLVLSKLKGKRIR